MKHILGTFLILALVGCSSGQKKAATVGNLKVYKTYDESFGKVPVSRLGKGVCPSVLAVSKMKDSKKLMKGANYCFVKKQYSRLYKIADRLSEVAPESPWGPYYHSVVSEHKGETDRAMWMIELSHKRAPKIGLILYQKGRLLWKEGFRSDGVREIENALKADSKLAMAHLFLGEVYNSELDFKKSKKHFKKALKTYPQSKKALLGLASAYIELESKTKALEILDRTISHYSRNLEARLKRAYVYEFLMDQPTEALTRYKVIKRLMNRRKLAGNLPFNINEKIKKLELTVKSTRQVAGLKGGKDE